MRIDEATFKAYTDILDAEFPMPELEHRSLSSKEVRVLADRVELQTWLAGDV